MRQAGVIAAAGLYALENNVERLKTDHENAERLASGLRELGLEVQHNTNMVLVRIAPDRAAAAEAHMKKNNILVLPRAPMRLVTHLDVDAAGIDRALAGFRSFLGRVSSKARRSRARALCTACSSCSGMPLPRRPSIRRSEASS